MRRQLYRIAVTHIWQRMSRPLVGLVFGYQRRRLPHIVEPHRAVEPQMAQELHVTSRVILVVVVDRLRKIYVRRLRHRLLEVDLAAYVVRVLYQRAALAAYANSPSVVRVVGLVHRHVAILHQRQQCRQLEGRAGLHAAAQGVVLLLDIDFSFSI